MLLSIVIMTHQSEGYLEKVLENLRPLANELVIAIDNTSTDRTELIARRFADVAVSLSHTGYIESHLNTLVKLCHGDWIFRIDDDEMLSADWTYEYIIHLLNNSPYSHYWIPRRWLVSENKYIRSHPWFPDYQMRLFRNDPNCIYSDGMLHTTHQITSGKANYIHDAYIHHYDFIWHSRQQRENKIQNYEKIKPGGSLPQYYLYEDYDLDFSIIKSEYTENVKINHSKTKFLEINHYVPKTMKRNRKYSLRIELTIGETLRCGEVLLSYHWLNFDGTIYNFDGLRTGLLIDLNDTETGVFFVLVESPNNNGNYLLQIDLVIEGQYWFSTKYDLSNPEFISPVRIVDVETKLINNKFLEMVQIETVSRCNAACIYCPWPMVADDWQYMDDNLFERVLEELKAFEIRKIAPYLSNEPFLDKQIINRIVRIRKLFPNTRIEISSNFSLVTLERGKQLAQALKPIDNSPIHDIWITVSGIDTESYRIQQGGWSPILSEAKFKKTKLDFNIIRRNILDFLKYVDEHSIDIGIRINGFGDEFYSKDDYLKFWRQSFDDWGISNNFSSKVRFFVPGKSVQSRANQIPVSWVSSDIAKQVHIAGCSFGGHFGWMDNALAIMADGQLSICCMDFNHRETSGLSLSNYQLMEILVSDRWRGIYDRLSGNVDAESNFICRQCEYAVPPGMKNFP